MRVRAAYPVTAKLHDETVKRTDNALLDVSYNIFPDIEHPVERAYYLPIINTIYLPPALLGPLDEEGMRKFDAVLSHELAHSVIARSFSSCILRWLATQIIGGLVKFTRNASGNERLLVPSFEIINPFDDESIRYIRHIQNIIDQFEEAYKATEALHELMADLRLAQRYSWGRTKTIRFMVEHVPGANGHLCNNLLDVYERHGETVADDLARYALDWYNLTTVETLQRFDDALQFALTLPPFPPKEDWAEYFATAWDFTEYFAKNLPGYQGGFCPITGNCLSMRLQKELEEEGAREQINPWMAMYGGTILMRQIRCGRFDIPEPKLVPSLVMMAVNDVRTELTEHMSDVLAVLDGRSPHEEWIRYFLAQPVGDEEPGKPRYRTGTKQSFIISPYGDESHETMMEPTAMGTCFEALRQQLFAGEGPYCLCYPNPQKNCPYQSVLQDLWDFTEPDTTGSAWKRQKPACL